MEPTVLHVIEVLATATLLAVAGLLLNQRSALVRIETLLTGATGDNGLVGDMVAIKEWRREVDGHGLPRRVEELELDRRHGPDDRRVRA